MSPDRGPRPAIDYVSPLPPVRSGISDYSLDLLPHLEPLVDLRVVRLPGQGVAAEVEQRFRPVEASRLGEEGRLPLFQMGNNLHHEAIPELAGRAPGILTLHDLVLHHLLLSRTVGRSVDFAAYERALEQQHGWIGRAVARPVDWGGFSQAAQFALPARRQLLRGQRGVLVHSRWAREQVLEDDPDLRVAAVPMAVPLPEPVEEGASRGFRRRLGIPETAPVLGSLGFQTPMKRTDQVVRALTREGLRQAHLIIAGEVASILDLDGLARQLGVAERVHLTGFLPPEEFRAALASCDLCCNLRYPTAGETSASMLRILAAGRPVVVSDYAQFAELPDDVVVKLPLGDGEVDRLAQLAAELLAAPEARSRLATRAREHVAREHDPGGAAEAIVAACREWADAPPPEAEAPRPRRPTSLTWSRFPAELEVDGVELPWRVGERRELRVRFRNRGDARWLGTRVGPGGMMVRIVFLGDGDERVDRVWLRMPHDLEPGEEEILTTRVRRPPGARRLLVEPAVAGNTSFWELGGPLWFAELEVPVEAGW